MLKIQDFDQFFVLLCHTCWLAPMANSFLDSFLLLPTLIGGNKFVLLLLLYFLFDCFGKWLFVTFQTKNEARAQSFSGIHYVNECLAFRIFKTQEEKSDYQAHSLILCHLQHYFYVSLIKGGQKVIGFQRIIGWRKISLAILHCFFFLSYRWTYSENVVIKFLLSLLVCCCCYKYKLINHVVKLRRQILI